MVLIDKAALLNKIAKEVHYDSEHSLEMYAKMLSLINDAPEVEAVPLEDYKSMEQTVNKLTEAIADAEPVRHGHWEVVDETEPRRYGCSVCKKLSWTEDNYCPNCGAKMDGRRTDETD